MRYDDDDTFTAFDTRTGKRVTLIKRALQPTATVADTLRAWPNPTSFNAVLARMRAEEMAKADHDDDSDDRENSDRNDGGGIADHSIVQLARLLVASGKFGDHAQALDHLLNTSHGAALLHRTRTHKAKDEPMDRIEELASVMKSAGLETFCTGLIANDSEGVSEPDLVAAATRYAKGLYPDLNGPAAFSRLYESDVTLRKAVQVAKAWPMPMSLEPMVATGASGFPSTRLRPGSSPGRADDAGDVDSVGVSDAYQQLMRLVEQQRRTHETSAQAFARIYSDPGNRHLAEAERAQARAANGTDVRVVQHAESNTSAYSELMAKAAELRKANPNLTEAQAFEKVYTDPANIEISKRERIESSPR
jgi:hypothetical protein